MDDFFADLLPTKPKDEATKAGTDPNASFQDDAVLPSKLESPKSTVSQSSLDLMTGDSQKAHTTSAQQPMGEPKMRRELKEYQQVTQAVVDGALKRFSGDLQRVLEDISRWACLGRFICPALPILFPGPTYAQASRVSRASDRAARESCG